MEEQNMTGNDSPFSSPNPHRLYRDPRRGKVFGVCAGIADYLGFDALPVRILAVLGLVFFTMPTLIGYFLLAFLLKPKPDGLYGSPQDEEFWRSVAMKPDRTLGGLRHKFRDLERRIGAMEACVTTREFELNRAINDLEK
jgi:phage shock protein C